PPAPGRRPRRPTTRPAWSGTTPNDRAGWRQDSWLDSLLTGIAGDRVDVVTLLVPALLPGRPPTPEEPGWRQGRGFTEQGERCPEKRRTAGQGQGGALGAGQGPYQVAGEALAVKLPDERHHLAVRQGPQPGQHGADAAAEQPGHKAEHLLPH